MKDWTGNSRSAHAILGARNYAQNEREIHDFYATEPKAARLLTEVEQFSHDHDALGSVNLLRHLQIF